MEFSNVCEKQNKISALENNHISIIFIRIFIIGIDTMERLKIDIIEAALITESNIRILSDTMKQMYEENGFKFFLRDAENILAAECVVLIGTHDHTHGMNCGHCGFATCEERFEGVPCAINTVDVGIAIGSACAVAADHRVDTRVMFSAGLAAQQLDWLDGCTRVFAIPVSASSKNPFFDRKPITVE